MKNFKSVLLPLFIFFLLPDFGLGSEVTIVDSGKAAAILVLPNSASVGEQLAAREMQKYIARSTDVQLEIFTETNLDTRSNMIQIHLGRTEQAIDYIQGFNKELILDEEFLIGSLSNHIFLIGGGDLGTRFAVYHFLEKYVGIRWFMPTELFEYIPKNKVLTVDFPFDIYQKPAFSPRVFGYTWYGEDYGYVGEKDPQYGCDIWATRNLLTVNGTGRPGDYSHNLFKIIVPSVYGKEHTEFFPLIDGKRYVPGSDSIQNWQPCLSNPEVLQITVQAARNYFQENQNKDIFSLGINDGYGWCECSGCKAMDTHPRNFRDREVMSERYFAFVNNVAKEIVKTHPNKWLGVIAYLNVELPPKGIKLESNVKVYVTQETCHYHDENYRQEDYLMLSGWASVCKAVCKYDYYTLGWILPKYYPELIQKDLQDSKKLGLKSYYVEDVPRWGNAGPLFYIGARLMWDPAANIMQMESDFCEKLFEDAAWPMQEYFRTLERVWVKPRQGKWFEGLGNITEQVVLFTKEETERCEMLLSLAKRMTKSDIVFERISVFSASWKIARLYISESNLINTLETFDVSCVDDCLNLMEEICRLESNIELRRSCLNSISSRGGLIGGPFRSFLEGLGYWGWEQTIATQLNSWANYSTTLLLDYVENKEQALRVVIENYPDTTIESIAKARLYNLIYMPANLLKNPGWEEGMKNWQTWSSSPGPVFQIDNNVAKTGNRSARISEAQNSACFLQIIPVYSEKKYWARCVVRTNNNLDGKTLMRIRWQDSNKDWIHFEQDVIIPLPRLVGTGEWFELSTTFSPPPGTAYVAILLSCEHVSSNNASWFDDAMICEVDND